MNPLLALALLAIGLVLLLYGANFLVHGASTLARRMGVSPLVVGLTVVGFGTSSPELVTSLMGGSAIAVGNVVGSNIMNLGLILGLTAVLAPIACDRNFLRFEAPLMAMLGPGFWVIARDGGISRLDGLGLVACLAVFLWASFKRGAKSEHNVEIVEEVQQVTEDHPNPGKCALLVLVGLVGLIGGGDLLVRGARALAEIAGVPERVVALTLIAGGTSLPELATCIVAARRGEQDIALGNVVGSNIFNILGILGVTAVVHPIEVPKGSLGIDAPAMIAMQFIAMGMMLWGSRVRRWEGAVLLVLFVAYIGLVVVRR